MTAPERYLVVSLGSIGKRHLRNLRALRPDARIAVLRLAAKAGQSELPEGANEQFHDIAEAIAFAPRAAIVAAPASVHLDVAMQLADAEVHLLVEKPIADRSEGVAGLIDRCEAGKRVLMVGYNLRFHPSLRAMKQLLDSGTIGQILSVRAEVGQYLPDWRPDRDYRHGVTARAELGGGVLLELSHEIDYLNWLIGLPKAVTARGGRLGDLDINVEDMVEMILEYPRPMLASIHLDMLQRAPLRQCHVVGTEGTLHWDGIADQLSLYLAVEKSWQEIEFAPMEDRNSMYMDELKYFLACIDAHQTPECDGHAGLAVLAVVEAARCSIATGKRVVIAETAHA